MILVMVPLILIMHSEFMFFSRWLKGRTRTATFTDDICLFFYN